MTSDSHGRTLIRHLLLLFLLPMFAISAAAFDGRVIDAKGEAVQGAHVAIIGRAGHARTDAEGRFSVHPDPSLPITLIVVGERGEVYPPLRIESLPPGEVELRLEPTFSDSVTVTSGAAPAIEAPPAAATLMVGGEELEQRKPQHLIDAVERIPGISRRGDGPAAVPVVRGLAGGRTLLLLDDARIVSERRAGPSGGFLNPFHSRHHRHRSRSRFGRVRIRCHGWDHSLTIAQPGARAKGNPLRSVESGRIRGCTQRFDRVHG